MKPLTFYSLAVTLTSFLVSGCNKGNDVAAKFNNSTISTKELNEYLLTKPTAKINLQGQPLDVPVVDTLGYQALEELMSQEALLQVATDEKITVTKEDVDKEIEFRKKMNSKFITDLSNLGFSVAQIEKKIKLDLIKEKLITKGVNVKLSEAEEYIKKNPQRFIEPATASLRWIYLSDLSKKNIVDQALKNGQEFTKVAIQYSQYPNTKQSNAVFPQRIIKSMPPVLQTAINKVPVGKTTDWMKLGPAIAKFYVETKTSEKSVNMDSTRKELLRRELALQQGTQKNNLNKKILAKLKSSKIEVSYPPLQNVWKRFEERLKETESKSTK